MRIVHGPDIPALPAAPASGPAAPDLGRVEALEKIVKSILQRLQALEEKEDIQEKVPNSPAPVPEITFSSNTISLDTEAMKKGLLTKMWKYLNDERSPKAA